MTYTKAKAWAATLGAFLTAVQSVLTPDTLAWNIVTAVLAVLTVVGVYAVPNKPTGPGSL